MPRLDEDSFTELVAPYRHELQVHCYRLLGSFEDAEEALQDTLLSVWRHHDDFEGRSSIRTWLYRIATNRCLDHLRAGRRAPVGTPLRREPPPPESSGEVPWLQPYPDDLLAPDPADVVEAREAISLAYVRALQMLPPRQRVVLVLRDVLRFQASEVAQILETTEESVTSALKRARAGLRRQLPPTGDREPPPAPGSPTEQALVAKFVRAYAAGDVDGLVALLTDDIHLSMPPIPLEYQGRADVARFYATVLRRDWTYDFVPTRANGQPALGAYLHAPTGIRHGIGLVVLTLSGDRISAITRFDTSVLPSFGLPRSLPS